ncbi:MAG: hypothetical protein NTNFB02_24600 [Nitrospira sp.]
MTSHNRASLSGGLGKTVTVERMFTAAYLFFEVFANSSLSSSSITIDNNDLPPIAGRVDAEAPCTQIM